MGRKVYMHDGCKGCKYTEKAMNELPCNHCRGSLISNNPFFEKCADLYEPVKPSNPYWERICEIADRQRNKGIQTYGQGLESNPAEMVERIKHLQEELIDGLMYCEWIKDKILECEQNE